MTEGNGTEQNKREMQRELREIVLPGDLIHEEKSKEKMRAGDGTYKDDGKIYSALLGVKYIDGNFVRVVPLEGVYNPHEGDIVIGIVSEVGSSMWMVDINAPYPALMHVNEVQQRLDFGETAQYLNVGETIVASVLSVDETKRLQVTMRGDRDDNLRKLKGGQIITVKPTRVRRIIGKSGSMISLITKYTKVRIFVGQNGRIWIDGDDENVAKAITAIRKIERESHMTGLTNEMEAYLKELMKK